MNDKNKQPSVRVISLGCPKNEVDSEEIAGSALLAGFDMNPSSEKIDVVIINTCGFLQDARHEAMEIIQTVCEEKHAGNVKKIIVAGCLAQRYKDDIIKEAPLVDMVVGVGRTGDFGDIIKSTLTSSTHQNIVTPPQHKWADIETRVVTRTPWSAYLKISDGCDHECAFCVIPSIRGKHISKPIERVMQEANRLAKRGIKELIVIAQDTTQYGYDLYKKTMLPELLKQLAEIEGIEWIRLMYAYPTRITDEFIKVIAEEPKILKYIDIPLQHSHKDILRSMKRPGDGESYLNLIQKMRDAIPGVCIRTTFIVGYPGETDEHFDDLFDFVRTARFDRLGVFPYSSEPGSPAAELPNPVDEETAISRMEELMVLQQEISLDINKTFINKELDVLIEAPDEKRGNFFYGRSYRDAPEIDGLVKVNGIKVKPGQIVKVKITKAKEYDLYGKCI